MDHNKLWKVLKEMGVIVQPYLSPEKPVCRSRSNRHGTIDRFKTGKGVCQGCILSLCLFTLCVEYITHHGKCWIGWITSWNQDCQEKYQQLQICKWYQSNGRKRKITKEPLDEGEGGQWQIDLKLNIQKTKIWSHHFMANRRGQSVSSHRFYFLGLQNHCRRWLQPWY